MITSRDVIALSICGNSRYLILYIKGCHWPTAFIEEGSEDSSNRFGRSPGVVMRMTDFGLIANRPGFATVS